MMSSLSPPPPSYSQVDNENKSPQFQQPPTQPYFQQGIPLQFIQQGQPQPMMQQVVVSLV